MFSGKDGGGRKWNRDAKDPLGEWSLPIRALEQRMREAAAATNLREGEHYVIAMKRNAKGCLCVCFIVQPTAPGFSPRTPFKDVTTRYSSNDAYSRTVPCALCNVTADLKDSHILPRWTYNRTMKMYGEDNNKLVRVGGGKAFFDTTQISEYLLCDRARCCLAGQKAT